MKIWSMILIIFLIFTIYTTQVSAEETVIPPSIISEAAIIFEADSGQILYEKNANVEMYPASITKIATALYAIKHGQLDDIVTVSTNARYTDGTRVYLEEGEQVSLKKLLQGLLINSGNDAGVAIAEHLSGTVEQFADDLNQYLEDEVGVAQTHFENPHGLFHPDHVTTAKDMAVITQYAMKNETFREIFSTKQMEWDGESWDTTLYNHHRMLRGEIPYEGITGGKNGFVSQSGFTLVTTAKSKDLNLIVVTLKASYEQEAYSDTVELLDFAFTNFITESIEKETYFSLDDSEFVTVKDLSYTHQLSDTVTPEIQKNGTLNITNQNGNVVTSFQLKDITPANEKNRDSSFSVQKDIQVNRSSSTLLWNTILIVIGIVIILSSMKYRQNRRMKSRYK
ncbi:D-alanyl-D-alanine carboxypeptidase family protein [Bacillus carboniphilus]|uniref:D-alanyl-D-alanine carboxypeptidase family protein n=1 Tax=Bacillus carboniphilus TaxID=86663 RepID=UPI0031DABF52